MILDVSNEKNLERSERSHSQFELYANSKPEIRLRLMPLEVEESVKRRSLKRHGRWLWRGFLATDWNIERFYYWLQYLAQRRTSQKEFRFIDTYDSASTIVHQVEHAQPTDWGMKKMPVRCYALRQLLKRSTQPGLVLTLSLFSLPALNTVAFELSLKQLEAHGWLFLWFCSHISDGCSVVCPFSLMCADYM